MSIIKDSPVSLTRDSENRHYHRDGATCPHDAEGFALCANCGSRVNCGMRVGPTNVEKRHRGTKVCKTAQQERDKYAEKKDGIIFSFLRPKAPIVPSTADDPPPVHSYKLVPHSASNASPAAASSTAEQRKAVSNSTSESILGPISNSFIKAFQDLVKNLPASVPAGSEFEKLDVLGGSPKEVDDPSMEADESWETNLNGMLKSTLG